MTQVVIAFDIAGILTTLVLLYGCIFEEKSKNKSHNVFILCVISVLSVLVVDLLSMILIERKDLSHLSYVIHYLDYIGCFFIGISFAYYAIEIIKTKKKISMWPARIHMIFGLFAIVLSTVLYANNLIISVVDGAYVNGPYYGIIYISTIISVSYILFILIKHGKVLGAHDTFVLIAYLLIPMAGSAIEIFVPGLEIAYASNAILLLLVYVMIQSNTVSSLQLHGKLLQELSYADSLTGLNNRRAYNKTLDEIIPGHPVGIVFCDLNGLKKANDTKGHQAGDELILRFKEMLVSTFSHEKVYRISGDEFTIIAIDDDEIDFLMRADALIKQSHDNGCIAAIGRVYGSTDDIYGLINEAERRMYQDKDEFYKDKKREH